MNRHEDELAVICCYVVMFLSKSCTPSNRFGISFGNFCQILKKCGNIKIGVAMIKKNRA